MSSPNDQNSSDPGPLAELRLRKPPFWLIAIVLIGFTGSLVPLSVIARARVNASEEPRVHIFQDMGNQPKYGPQTASKVFADGRADRPVIEGTVSRTAILDNPHLTQGYTKDAAGTITWLAGYPKGITVDAALLERGRQRFNIYCSACHGVDGRGNGMVNVRAKELLLLSQKENSSTEWTPPANLHDDVRRGRTEGHIFNTITNGIRNMPALGHQVPVMDRWAIISYVRALQLSDNAPPSALPEEVRSNLK